MAKLWNKDIIELLKRIYLRNWKEIFAFSVFRLLHNSPIKHLMDYYSTSFLSELIPDAHLSPKPIGNLLTELGKEREKIRTFLYHFILGTQFAVIDLTHVFSLSENIISATLGYTSKEEFIPQVNLVFILSLDTHSPAYFRTVPGSIRDVSSLILTLRESGVKNVVLIGDKGFYSEDNVKSLHDLQKIEDASILYVFSLRRNLLLINYTKMRKGDRKEFDGFFMFEERPIWYYSYLVDEKKKIVVYLDEKLRAEEEKDYLGRIEKDDKEKLENFFEKQWILGTIAVITNIKGEAQKIYGLPRCRIEIELLIDTFKNVLEANRTYMQDHYSLEGWMCINFIAIIFLLSNNRLLTEKELLNNYSPKDVLIHLSRVYKLKIGDNWVLSEIPKKTRNILEKLQLCITQNK